MTRRPEVSATAWVCFLCLDQSGAVIKEQHKATPTMGIKTCEVCQKPRECCSPVSEYEWPEELKE